MTAMLIETSDVGLKETRTHNIISTNVKEICAFLQKNGTTGGFTVQFAVNRSTGKVVEIFKNGKLVQRDIKPLVEAGFTEFLFSWAFAGKNFRLDSGETVRLAGTVDLTKLSDLLPLGRALGMI